MSPGGNSGRQGKVAERWSGDPRCSVRARALSAPAWALSSGHPSGKAGTGPRGQSWGWPGRRAGCPRRSPVPGARRGTAPERGLRVTLLSDPSPSGLDPRPCLRVHGLSRPTKAMTHWHSRTKAVVRGVQTGFTHSCLLKCFSFFGIPGGSLCKPVWGAGGQGWGGPTGHVHRGCSTFLPLRAQQYSEPD